MVVTSSTNATYSLTTDEAITPILTITSITVGNAIIDSLKIYNNADDDITEWDGTIDEEWDVNTVLCALFDYTLVAGSIEESVEGTSEIRIKRRIKGTTKWYTLFIVEVDEADDFSFDLYDNLNASKITYEYAYVPVVDNEESTYIVAEVDSIFTDYFLCEKDSTVHAVVNSGNSVTYNQETSYQTTISRKYPYVIKNGSVGYYSGTLEAVWVDSEDGCEFDFEDGAFYRIDMDQYLANGNPKILKDWLGNIYMVMIVDAIPQENTDHYHLPSHQMNWVECGDYSSIGDLYDNGLIDVDIDR